MACQRSWGIFALIPSSAKMANVRWTRATKRRAPVASLVFFMPSFRNSSRARDMMSPGTSRRIITRISPDVLASIREITSRMSILCSSERNFLTFSLLMRPPQEKSRRHAPPAKDWNALFELHDWCPVGTLAHFEIAVLLEAEDLGGHDPGEAPDRGVVSAHVPIEVSPLDRDAVLGSLERIL